ncbi:MAG TPA: DedA family protein [Nitrososphaerales archaeon]|nr:DedA family protein [Nitrososphaerales archaeon]
MKPSKGWWPPPRSIYLVSLAAVLLSLAIFELVDFVELPFESQLAAASSSSLISASSLTAMMSSYGYLGLFVLMTFESASAPIPSEVILPFAGYLVYQGSMAYVAAVATSTVAGVLGALIDFYLALLVGRSLLIKILSKVGVQPASVDRAERWMNERGSWTVFLARFVPGLRSIISIPAGLLGMRLKAFVGLTAMGSLVWSAALIYLGYSTGALWSSALRTPGSGFTAIEVFVALVSGAYLAYYALPGRRTTHHAHVVK